MKIFWPASLAVLLLLSVIAWWIRPEAAPAGKIPLLWVSDDAPARREQISLFNQLNPEYSLRLDPGNLEQQKVIVQSLAGVGPDMFSSFDSFSLSGYVKAGIAWDITEELSKAGIDPVNDIWTAAAPTYMYEGRAYGFPANVAADAIWYNKKLFDEHGVSYPSGPMTWEQFLPIAKKLTVADPGGRIRHYGLLCDANAAWQQFVMQWGGSVYSADGTRCTLDSPEAIAGMTFLNDLAFKYKVCPTVAELTAMATQGGWGQESISLFGGERAAMAFGGRWWLVRLRQYEKLRLGAFECPHAVRRVFRGYGKGILINKHSPRKHDALAFVRYASGAPYNELINHQADALAPVKKYCFTEKYLHDPAFPKEDFNAMWRDIMEVTEPEQISPFVNGNVATRILTRQLDLMKAGQKSAADTMRTIAREINLEIERTIKTDPDLGRRYAKLTGKQPW